jgi:hypothetical protein
MNYTNSVSVFSWQAQERVWGEEAPLSLSFSPLRGARGRHPTMSKKHAKK